jgi:hypothetical protein
VFSFDTLYAGIIGTFKKIDFTVLNEEEIEVLLIPRKTGTYYYELFIDNAIAGAGTFIDSINGILYPYQMQLFGDIFTWDIFFPRDSIFEYHGPFVITIDYLFALLQGVGLSEYDESNSETINVKVFPNPFILHTNFELQLKKSTFIDFSIYNSLGQRVKTIYQGYIDEGKYNFSWDCTDDKGQRMTSGTYFYKIQSPGSYSCNKLIMLN